MKKPDEKHSTQQTPPKKETGVLTERADLTNPEPNAKNQAEEQTLLPHERDQTTRPTGTGQAGDEQAREVIGQAKKDTERGLKDTDRRGIPSDIVESDVPAEDDKPGVPSDKKTRKR